VRDIAVRRKSRNRALRKGALALLRSPYFFMKLLAALRRNGLIGEERNAVVTYIVASSRLLDRPLCLLVKGPSGTGKNFLADSVFALVPPSDVQTLSSSSTRSWNYLGRRLAHKIVYVKERNDASGSTHPSRLLISETQLIHWVATKQRGRFVRQQRITKGPIAAVSTTTQPRVEVDDETRHISIRVDESQRQTLRIMKSALSTECQLTKKEIRVWHEVQQLLKTRAKARIEFPQWFHGLAELVSHESVWTRRYFSGFLQACKTVALIRSFRRSTSRQKSTESIKVRFSDFAITTLLFNRAFTDSLNKSDDEDLDTQLAVQSMSNAKNGAAVRATEFAEKMNISLDRAYGLLRKALQSGALRRGNPPAQSNIKTYLPSEDRSFLPDPQKVLRELKGTPWKVRFLHPLTGKWVSYRR
jgi:hypothetical protein